MSQQREYIENVRKEVKQKLLQAGFKSIRNEDSFDIFQAPENTSLQLNFADTNHDVESVFLYAADITVDYSLPDNETFSISMPLEKIVKIDITVHQKVDYVDKNFIYKQLIEAGFKRVPKSKKRTSNKETIELIPSKGSDIVINHIDINNKITYITLYEYFMIVEFSNQDRKFETSIEYYNITSFDFK